jgi:GT2 family glycosyltransferase
LNYNGREHLATCLPTLKAQVYPRDRVRVEVIDNGSADGSAEFVRMRHPEVVWHQLDRNYGFAQPYDAAARSGTSQYVAFLNNDTRVEPTWLAELVSAAERHDAQCVASKILDWDGNRIDFVGGLVSYLGHCWQRQHGELTTAGEEADEEGRRLLFACGGSMLISRAALDAGGFDKDFFAYFEDVDLGSVCRCWGIGPCSHRAP